jgi:hypothetical protein
MKIFQTSKPFIGSTCPIMRCERNYKNLDFYRTIYKCKYRDTHLLNLTYLIFRHIASKFGTLFR